MIEAKAIKVRKVKTNNLRYQSNPKHDDLWKISLQTKKINDYIMKFFYY